MNNSPYDREYLLSQKEKDEGKVTFDYYKIINMIGTVTSPWRQHAGKKVLFGGGRGHKDLIKDLKEAIWSLQCEVEELERLIPVEKPSVGSAEASMWIGGHKYPLSGFTISAGSDGAVVSAILDQVPTAQEGRIRAAFELRYGPCSPITVPNSEYGRISADEKHLLIDGVEYELHAVVKDTSVSSCSACEFRAMCTEPLRCSPGTRRDGLVGVWVEVSDTPKDSDENP